MAEESRMPVFHRIFRKRSWEEACDEAKKFLDGLKNEQIISVSHVSEPPNGVVFVWYTADNAKGPAEGS